MKHANSFIGAFVFLFALPLNEFGRYFMQNCFSFYYSKEMLKKLFNFAKIILIKNSNFGLTLRKRLFCIAKQPLLPCKTYAFGMQNNRFYNVLVMRRLDDRCFYKKYLHIYKLLLASKWTVKSR